jgi:EthD domain
MIRLTAMLCRNPALTPEEFRQHWATTHAQLIRTAPGVAENILRYEQHPRLAGGPGEWTGGDGFDGVTVQLFRSRADLEAMLRSPAYRRDVAPDEQRLLDFERSAFLLTDEPRLVIG